MIRAAQLSDDGLYRYSLRRAWEGGRGLVVWIMFNPSTGDAEYDDPTIRRCIGFSRLWGYAALEIVNLFAMRSPDPRLLVELGATDDCEAAEAIGQGTTNDQHIIAALSRADLAVAAWGAHGPAWRVDQVLQLIPAGLQLQCLGRTLSGAPRHPLYAPAKKRLEPFWRSP